MSQTNQNLISGTNAAILLKQTPQLCWNESHSSKAWTSCLQVHRWRSKSVWDAEQECIPETLDEFWAHPTTRQEVQPFHAEEHFLSCFPWWLVNNVSRENKPFHSHFLFCHLSVAPFLFSTPLFLLASTYDPVHTRIIAAYRCLDTWLGLTLPAQSKQQVQTAFFFTVIFQSRFRVLPSPLVCRLHWF